MSATGNSPEGPVSDLKVLLIASCTMFASLSLVHWLSIAERAQYKRVWFEYEKISESDDKAMEMGTIGGDESKIQHGLKPRAPLLDFLRGLCLAFIVSFHFMWDLQEFDMLPHPPPAHKVDGLPIKNYILFIVYFVISITSCLTAALYTPYLGYALYAPIVTYCIYSMWWESQISGVCLIMTCLGMSQALVHRNGTIWREVVIRAAKLSLLAALISALSLWFDPEQWIYFGAVHCICLNSLLTVPFVRRPKTALAGFLFIQTYTMAFGACPIEVPLELPTLDVMPWFHNFGYCLLGVWLYSKGVHKLSSCSIIPNTRVYFEDTVMTTFGRHSLLIYLAHQGVLFPLVYGVSRLS